MVIGSVARRVPKRYGRIVECYMHRLDKRPSFSSSNDKRKPDTKDYSSKEGNTLIIQRLKTCKGIVFRRTRTQLYIHSTFYF